MSTSASPVVRSHHSGLLRIGIVPALLWILLAGGVSLQSVGHRPDIENGLFVISSKYGHRETLDLSHIIAPERQPQLTSMILTAVSAIGLAFYYHCTLVVSFSTDRCACSACCIPG